MNKDKEKEPLGFNENLKNDQILVSESICRICLDSSSEGLISPCKCKGTGKFCHEKCLKTWILLKYSTGSVPKCEVCGSEYNLRLEYEWKVNFKRGLLEKFSYCCSIPILISVMITFVVIISIIAQSHSIDFEDHLLSSILILVFCTLPGIVVLIFLTRSIRFALLYKEIKDVVILNLT